VRVQFGFGLAGQFEVDAALAEWFAAKLATEAVALDRVAAIGFQQCREFFPLVGNQTSAVDLR
jgi:hypothetical protein